MGLDRLNMRPIAEHFARDWQVLIWDMPGHGDAQAVSDYSMDALVGAMEQAMADAGATDPVIIGFSFGGCLAQHAVRRDPGRYRGLVAYGCYAPFHQSPPVPRWLIPAVAASYALQPWQRISRNFAKACAMSAKGQDEVERAVSRSSKATFVTMVRSLLRSFDSTSLVRFDMPLLVLRGIADEQRPATRRAAAALLGAHPHANSVVIAESGHCVHDDNLPAAIGAIGQFLSQFKRETPR